MPTADTLAGWARYYRQQAETVRAKNPTITPAVLKLHMQREFGFGGLILDAVVDRMFGIDPNDPSRTVTR